MKNLKKVALFMTCLLVMAIVCTPKSVYADDIGPNKGEFRQSSIMIYDNSDNKWKYLFKDISEAYHDEYADCTSHMIEGFTYIEDENMLIANDGSYSDYIVLNEMGDDFKISVIGQSTIGNIASIGNGYSASITVEGGILYTEGILLYGTDSDTSFTVKNSATVVIVGQMMSTGTAPFRIVSTKRASDAIVANCNYDIIKQKQPVLKNYDFYLEGEPVIATQVMKDGKKYYAITKYGSDGYALGNNVYTANGKTLKFYEFVPGADEESFNKFWDRYEMVTDTCYNYGCTEFETIIFTSTTAISQPLKGEKVYCADIAYKVTKAGTREKAGTVSLHEVPNSITNLVVPAYIVCDGIRYKVTAIEQNACAKSKISAMILPSTIKKIGKKAFYKCSKLKKIMIVNSKPTSMTVKSKAFYGVSKKCEIRVSGDDANAYANLLQAAGLNKNVKITTYSELIAGSK